VNSLSPAASLVCGLRSSPLVGPRGVLQLEPQLRAVLVLEPIGNASGAKGATANPRRSLSRLHQRGELDKFADGRDEADEQASNNMNESIGTSPASGSEGCVS
jgi:hypothetical protein